MNVVWPLLAKAYTCEIVYTGRGRGGGPQGETKDSKVQQSGPHRRRHGATQGETRRGPREGRGGRRHKKEGTYISETHTKTERHNDTHAESQVRALRPQPNPKP